MHLDDWESISQAMKQVNQGRTVFLLMPELMQRCTFRWVMWNVISVPSQQLFYAVGRDITQQKQTQEELNRYNAPIEGSKRICGNADLHVTGTDNRTGNMPV